MEHKDYERIAKLETQLESVTEGLKRIETKLDAYSANFITREEANIRFKAIDKDIEEMKQNKKANNALIVSIASVVLTFIFQLINLLK
ncbi:hypothetical protein [Caldibacillus debilis]|uniref:Uncharacterized protein n=1 Tax=Caldibacillus debilis GB1 TaxID=1339248 RepID=A0A420VJ27_9BACI|nr:hypothetical protein [Caldibacillus debilis]RKO63659.1 hypothetical protein Cdeb_02729 [Caldibacillus debilis GB1]